MIQVLSNDETRAFFERVSEIIAQRKEAEAPGPRTMSALAEKLGVNRSTLSNLARGRSRLRLHGEWPSAEAVWRLLDVPPVGARITFDELLGVETSA